MPKRPGGKTMRQKRSWEITDEFWEAAKPGVYPFN